MSIFSILRGLLIALVALGVISGTPALASSMTMDHTQVSGPCAGSFMTQACMDEMGGGKMSGGVSKDKLAHAADCAVQMGCAGDFMPGPFASSFTLVRFTKVVFWSPSALPEGLSVEPGFLPPRSI